MRFKRVDKSTVRCIVSQDEIEERGLKIEDLIKNGDKAQEFLNEVVDMAEEEIGFKMTSGLCGQAPNHSSFPSAACTALLWLSRPYWCAEKRSGLSSWRMRENRRIR